MTGLQKDMMECMLRGYTIAQFRVRDETGYPFRRISRETFEAIKPYLRRQKLLWVIDLRKVRSLHGNSRIKKLYKKSRNKIQSTF